MNLLSRYEKRQSFNIEQMNQEEFLQCLLKSNLHCGIIKYYDDEYNLHIIKCIHYYYKIDCKNNNCYHILKKTGLDKQVPCNQCIECHKNALNKWQLEELSLR